MTQPDVAEWYIVGMTEHVITFRPITRDCEQRSGSQWEYVRWMSTAMGRHLAGSSRGECKITSMRFADTRCLAARPQHVFVVSNVRGGHFDLCGAC